MTAALTLESLSAVRNERTLFANLSLTVSAGEAVMLVGPNGVGKTTLLRLIAGFIAPAAGAVALSPADGERDVPQRAQLVGARDPLKAALSVRELLEGWRDIVYPGEAEGDSIERVLDALDLARLADIPCGYLSSGQRRRVSLARLGLSHAARRPLWLLDEPTNALDAAARARLAALVAAHRAGGGMVLAASHDPLDWPALGRLDLAAARG